MHDVIVELVTEQTDVFEGWLLSPESVEITNCSKACKMHSSPNSDQSLNASRAWQEIERMETFEPTYMRTATCNLEELIVSDQRDARAFITYTMTVRMTWWLRNKQWPSIVCVSSPHEGVQWTDSDFTHFSTTSSSLSLPTKAESMKWPASAIAGRSGWRLCNVQRVKNNFFEVLEFSRELSWRRTFTFQHRFAWNRIFQTFVNLSKFPPNNHWFGHWQLGENLSVLSLHFATRATLYSPSVVAGWRVSSTVTSQQIFLFTSPSLPRATQETDTGCIF